MRILITGSAGAIGSHMAERLAYEGHDVYGIDAFTDYYDPEEKRWTAAELFDQGIEIRQGDLVSSDLGELVHPDTEFIYHFAAQPGIAAHVSHTDYVHNNMEATARLLEHARTLAKLRGVVYISTSSIYGVEAVGQEEQHPRPTSFYGATKLGAEQLALSYHRRGVLPIAAARLFSVYGERERPEKLFRKLIKAIDTGTPFPLYQGSREHKRSYTYVGDIVDGLHAMLLHWDSCKGETFNLGIDSTRTTGEGIEIVERLMGKKGLFEERPPRPGDQLETSADISKARRVFGYDPKTRLEEGLARQVAWYLARKNDIRLIVATPLYPPEAGGPGTYARRLETGLPSRDITPILVKFHAVRKYPKLIRHIAYYYRVLRALRRADGVLALDPVSVGLPSYLAARMLGKPFVVKIVGDYAWEQGRQRFGVTAELDEFLVQRDVPLPVKVMRAAQTFVARGADRIIVPSEYLKRVVESWGIPGKKITVIYNAIPRGHLADTVPEFGLPRPLVVTAGRLVPWKGIPGVIDAVASLQKGSLAIVGDGPDREKLEAHAASKFPGRHVFTGMLPHEEALAVLASADAFVLNSTYEGLSHLLIEALSLGVPTIAVRIGGNPEVITHEKDGLLIPAGDTEALAKALRRLLSDEKLRASVRVRALESAGRFSEEAMLDSTAKLLKTAVQTERYT